MYCEINNHNNTISSEHSPPAGVTSDAGPNRRARRPVGVCPLRPSTCLRRHLLRQTHPAPLLPQPAARAAQDARQERHQALPVHSKEANGKKHESGKEKLIFVMIYFKYFKYFKF